LRCGDEPTDELIAEVESDILVRRRPESFGYHRIDLVSETNLLANGVTSDTALGGCMDRDELGLSEDWFLHVLGDLDALVTNVPGFDALIVLFNSEIGRANAAIDVATDPGLRLGHERTIRMGLHHDAKVLTHELGHVLFGLGDEYADSDAAYVEESRYVTSTLDPLVVTPNLSLEASGAKWQTLVEGARPGGRRYGSGIYHPTEHCRMSTTEADRFCPVCEHRIELVLALFAEADINDGPPRCGIEMDQPADEVSGAFDLQLSGFDLNGVRMDRYSVDGKDLLPVFTATAAACPPHCFVYDANPHHGFALGTFDGDRLGPGPHQMSLRCVDALGLGSESSITIDVRP
jgi:hypothetical protein